MGMLYEIRTLKGNGLGKYYWDGETAIKQDDLRNYPSYTSYEEAVTQRQKAEDTHPEHQFYIFQAKF